MLTALQALVERRLDLTEQGHQEADLPDAPAYLAECGIDLPDRKPPRIIRTIHVTPAPEGHPVCDDGKWARPGNCRHIDGNWICDWICG